MTTTASPVFPSEVWALRQQLGLPPEREARFEGQYTINSHNSLIVTREVRVAENFDNIKVVVR